MARRRRSLAQGHQSSYVTDADGHYCWLCRVQPPGAAPELSVLKVPAFSRPLRKVGASRAADQEKRVEPERRRSQATFVPGTVLRSGMAGARMGSLASQGERLKRPTKAFSNR